MITNIISDNACRRRCGRGSLVPLRDMLRKEISIEDYSVKMLHRVSATKPAPKLKPASDLTPTEELVRKILKIERDMRGKTVEQLRETMARVHYRKSDKWSEKGGES